MKAKDFLKESEKDIHPYMKAALCGVVTVDDMDQEYDYYRFMTVVAGSPNTSSTSAVLRDKPIAVAYTEADKMKIDSALKQLGKKGKWVNSVASEEPADTNKVSPVAQIKRNKHGI